MAVKTTIAAEVKVDGLEKSAQSVGSLKKQLREAQNEVTQLSEKFGLASEQAVAAAKRAGALKNAIGDAKALTDAYNPNAKFKSFGAAIQGVTAGFTAYQGALGLIGVESKQVEETLLRVQSAMALSQGLNGLLEFRNSFKILKSVAVDAFKSIKAAIGSTGIGLFVIAIGTVVAYWDEIKETVSGVSEEQKNLNKLTSENLKTQQDKLKSLNSQDNVLKLQGKSEKDILNLKVKQYDQVIATAKADLIGIEETEKARIAAAERNNNILKSVLRVAMEINTAVLRGLAAPIDAMIFAINTISKALGKGNLIETNLNSLITSMNKTVSEQVATMIFDPAKTREEGQKTIDEAKKNIDELVNQKAGLELQIQDIDKKSKEKLLQQEAEFQKALRELRKTRIEEEKKIDEDAYKYFSDLKKQQDEGEKKRLEDNAKNALIARQKIAELSLINDPNNIDKRIEKLKADLEVQNSVLAEDDVQRMINTRRTELEINKIRKEGYEADLKAKREVEAAKYDAVEMAFGAVSELIGRETAAGKVFATAQALINTYQGATEVLRSKSTLPEPFATISKIANVAAVIATGIKAVKQINQVKVPGAGSGGSASAANISAPLTPQVQTTRLDQGSINQIGNAAAPRAYVLEQDVTSNQERIKQLNRAARIN